MNKILKYIGVVFVTVVFSWVIHEFFHWLTNKVLGYEVTMTMNTVYLLEGSYTQKWHRVLVSASGPIITIVQAIIVFFYLKKRWKKFLYPLLFVPFYMRFLAGIVSYLNPNDEARISYDLGIGTYTLPLIVSGFLFYLLYIISKQYKLTWKFQLTTTVLVMFFSSVLIMVDQLMKWKIL